MSHLNLSPTSLRRLRRPAPARRQRGFSLLEALVSIVVLSFGLLGVAGLQAASLKYSRDARNQSVAVNLAREMAEMIRSNARVSGKANNPYLSYLTDDDGKALTASAAEAAVGAINVTGTTDAFTDQAGEEPGTGLAKAQVKDWAYRVDQLLPGAYVAVCKDKEPYDKTGDHIGAPHWACTGDGDIIAIKIGWEREDTAGAIKVGYDEEDTSIRPYVVLPVTPAGQQ